MGVGRNVIAIDAVAGANADDSRSHAHGMPPPLLSQWLLVMTDPVVQAIPAPLFLPATQPSTVDSKKVMMPAPVFSVRMAAVEVLPEASQAETRQAFSA